MANLTDKQELFSREFIKDLNATQAAIRAGYSEKSSRNQGARMMANDDILHRIAELNQERLDRLQIDADYVLRQAVKLHERCMQEVEPLVSVKPMVAGFTGNGDIIPNQEPIHGVLVWRLQRGASAVIMPPVEGDIGLIVVCDRDITAVKKTKQSALPGSNRTHSYSDAIYLGGVLNAEPSQYVKFANDGIDIVSPWWFR